MHICSGRCLRFVAVPSVDQLPHQMATDSVDMFHFWKQVELSVLEKAADAGWNMLCLISV